jgi:hypothetical protein
LYGSARSHPPRRWSGKLTANKRKKNNKEEAEGEEAEEEEAVVRGEALVLVLVWESHFCGSLGGAERV